VRKSLSQIRETRKHDGALATFGARVTKLILVILFLYPKDEFRLSYRLLLRVADIGYQSRPRYTELPDVAGCCPVAAPIPPKFYLACYDGCIRQAKRLNIAVRSFVDSSFLLVSQDGSKNREVWWSLTLIMRDHIWAQFENPFCHESRCHCGRDLARLIRRRLGREREERQ
jgi:hypothetical protein